MDQDTVKERDDALELVGSRLHSSYASVIALWCWFSFPANKMHLPFFFIIDEMKEEKEKKRTVDPQFIPGFDGG